MTKIPSKSKRTSKSKKTPKEEKDYRPFIIGFRSNIKDKNLLSNLDEYILEHLKMNKYELSPLSGSEYKYDPKSWNKKRVKNNNNCYSYVTGRILSNRHGKPQPGYFSHHNSIQEHEYNDCNNFYKRIKKDIPSMYTEKFNQPCKKGYFKGFIALDNKEGDKDYHFYRQDKNKRWSHKPGTTEVINYDADGKLINNPLLANRKYKYYNYSKPCFFFCVPKHGARTSAKVKY